MRALLPDPADDVDVHEHYAAGWLDAGGFRVNFVASVDGAATLAGRSRGLQTPGDNRVFAALRDLADVVVAGAGTVRDEGYGPTRPSDERRAIRQRFGLAPVAPIAVITRSLDLDPAAPLFTEAEVPTIVLTCASSRPPVRAQLAAVADVVDCGADAVEPALARAALTERGLTRVLCEGGPTLFADFAAADQVDELCLSVTPLLAGPALRQIVSGRAWMRDPVQLRLAGLLEEDGALFARYRTR